MASKRDIIIAFVIGGVFLFGMGLMTLLFIFAWSDQGEYIDSGSGQIAIVEVFGPIYDSSTPVRQIDKWAERIDIEAIVVHVNSPGGGVAASQEIYYAIERARNYQGKIVVISMSSVAASGGYYLACAGDIVVANPGTLTGSIGVIVQYPTFGEFLEKVGIKFETVKSGNLKDLGNPSRSMTNEEKLMLKSVIMDSYEQFVDVVARGRGMEKEVVYPLADGRIYTGLQAYNLGLVDTLGTLKDAIDIAAEMSGLEGKPETVKEIKKRPGLIDLLGEATFTLREIRSLLTGETRVGPEILYLYH